MSAQDVASRIVAGLSFVALLAGCTSSGVDLQAVQDFGKTTTAAAASFQEISDDYYLSCLRYRDYRAETRLGTQPLTAIPTHAPIAAMPGAEPAARPEPTVTDEPVVPRPEPTTTPLLSIAPGGDDRDCKVSQTLSARWSLEDSVLVGYVQALASVAGVGTAPSQSSFESVGSALESAGAIDGDATAKAGGDLAAAIVGALIARQQQRDLVGLATDANGPVTTLATGLEQAAIAYQTVVRDELAELDSNRILLISSETQQLRHLRELAGLPPDSPADPAISDTDSAADVEKRATTMSITPQAERARMLAALLLRDRISRQRATWSTDIDDAVRRANMAVDYYRAIAAIKKTQASLVTTQSGFAALVATVTPLVCELSDPVNALIAASKAKSI
jgi:hypothetical protein